MNRLVGKVALVTGAASGIGAAISKRFASEGADVVGFDLSETGNEDWAAAVEARPASRLRPGSVVDPDRIDEVVTETVEDFGGIDILVNNAGFSITANVHESSIEDWDLQINVNLKGVFLVSRAVLPHMIGRDGSNIINIASTAGLEGLDLCAAYNAAKGGVVVLSKNMAIDYGDKGIRVNAICPGFIETPGVAMVMGGELTQQLRDLHQLKRMGTPAEIGSVAAFLASDDASFVTGIAMPVDGGFTAGKNFGLADTIGAGAGGANPTS